jgi:hypothetical protein
MLLEITVFAVFSVDVERQKMVVTSPNGANHIMYVDDQSVYPANLFKKSFDRIIGGQYIKLKIDGQIDEAGNIKATRIEE